MHRRLAYPLLCTLTLALAALHGEEASKVEPTPIPSVEVAPGTTAETRASLARFFDELNAVFWKAEAPGIAAVFDGPRMIAEMERNLGSFTLAEAVRKKLMDEISVGLGAQLSKTARFLRWARLRLLKVQPQSSPDECSVFVREWREDGTSSKIRWWLKRSGTTWRVYDLEELSSNMRVSALMATGINQQRAVSSRTTVHLQNIAGALSAIADGDTEKADALLGPIPTTGLPPFVESMRCLMLSVVRIQQGRTKDALALCDQGLAASPDMIMFHQLRASSFFDLEQYEQAISACRKYAEVAGRDPEVFFVLARSLLALKRNDEALAVCRESLDEEPDDADMLLLLSGLLPAHGQAELTERFARSPYHARHFEKLAQSLLNIEDYPGLEALCEGQRKLKPDDPLLLYFQAQACRKRKELDRALTIYRNFMAQLETKEKREAYQEDYWQLHVEMGRWSDAYAEAQNVRAAFAYFAQTFLDEESFADLRKLLRLHARREPKDAQVHYYAGEAYMQEFKYREAEREYQLGFSGAADEKEREDFRFNRVFARLQDGRGLTAYEDRIEPLDATFRQLARHYVQRKMPDQLEALLILRRRDISESADLGWWRSGITWLRGEWAATVDVLTAQRESILADQTLRDTYYERLVRCLVRLGRKDEALTAAQAGAELDLGPRLLLIAHAFRGDVEKVRKYFPSCLDEEEGASSPYNDADVGAILRGPLYADLHKRYPPPTKESGAKDLDE